MPKILTSCQTLCRIDGGASEGIVSPKDYNLFNKKGTYVWLTKPDQPFHANLYKFCQHSRLLHDDNLSVKYVQKLYNK
jgi:hypothetical protein